LCKWALVAPWECITGQPGEHVLMSTDLADRHRQSKELA